MGCRMKKILKSDFMEIKSELESILVNMKNAIQDEDIYFDAKLILDELVCNSILHGNREDRDKEIEIDVEISEHLIMIQVKDQGVGFDYNKADYNPMNFESNGRGLFLVDGLSDELYIDKNIVKSIKHINRN